MKKHHPMVHTLLHLRGNPRACVYTEPMWGIPFNLYAPYVSIYMYTLGVKDAQIGLIASIGMACQIIFALLSGAITDKIGRRKVTFLFDFIAWSVPCLIWAVAQNFTYFVIAAVVNSVWRVTANSWMCLMVEDADQSQLVDIYAWVHISGLLAAFFAPLAGFFVAKYQVVSTVRVLYLIAFVLMTAKFIILYFFSTETKQGSIRLEETKDQSILVLLGQYGGVLKQILKTPETLFTLGIMLVMSICNMVNGAFWSLFVTEKLHLPPQNISIFPFIRSAVMLILYFYFIPKISAMNFKKPMLIGFCMFIISQVLLITTPEKGYILLVISILLEAFSLAMITPLMDSLAVITVNPQERARIMAILYVIIIGLTSPFGWIAGNLSQMHRALPFIMNIILFALGAVLVSYSGFLSKKETQSISA